jgi:hypothetical protein
MFAARAQLARWARADDGDDRGAGGRSDQGDDPATHGEAGREL